MNLLGGVELLLVLLLPILLWVLSLVHLMLSKHDGTYKLTWALIIIFLPVIGALLYLFVSLFQAVRS